MVLVEIYRLIAQIVARVATPVPMAKSVRMANVRSPVQPDSLIAVVLVEICRIIALIVEPVTMLAKMAKSVQVANAYFHVKLV
jgi:hypothetical protein